MEIRLRLATIACLAAVATACGGGEGSQTTDTGGGSDADAGSGDTIDNDGGTDADGGGSDADAGGDDTDGGGDDTDAGGEDTDGGGDDTDAGDDTSDGSGDDAGDAGDASDGSGDDAGDTGGDTGPTPVCGDGVLDDGEACDNGADNSDTVADACRLDCSLAACGDGTIDTAEICDDGADNSNRIPDRCRETCVEPSCGDSTVDSGEQCDLGPDNSADGVCSLDCVLNLDAACDGVNDLIVLEDVASVTDGVLTYAGSTDEASDDLSAPAGCTTVESTGNEVVLVFVPPTDGDYVVSTEGDGTLSDTIVWALDDCVDGIDLACNDDSSPGSSASRLTLEALSGGVPVYLVVESRFGTGEYDLTVAPVTDLSPLLGPCSTSLDCEAGLDCVERDGAGRCETDTAPVITESIAVRIDADTATHIVRGTDINRDVVDLQFTAFTFEDGAIEPGPLGFVTPPFVRVDGDNFEIRFTAAWDTFGLGTTPITSVDIAAFDTAGLISDAVTTPIGPFVEPTVGAEGDPCDPDGLTSVCDVGLSCLGDDTAGFFCGAGTAPVLTSIAAEWIDVGVVQHTYVGTDAERDVTGEQIVEWLSDAFGDIVGFLTLPATFDSVSWDGDTYTAIVTWSGVDGIGLTSLTSSVVDGAGLVSNELTISYPAEPTIVELGEGDGCDPTNSFAVCAVGLVCSPDGSAFACATGVAPVLAGVEAYDLTAERDSFEFQILGSDVNADVEIVVVTAYTAVGAASTALEFTDEDASPGFAGRVSFLSTIGPIGSIPDFVEICVQLVDSSGLVSSEVCDSLLPESGAGAPCSYDGTLGTCDNALGLTCGTTGVCEANVAPTLNAVNVLRPSAAEMEVVFDGTDPNGDVVRWETYLTDDAGTVLAGPLVFVFEADLRGITEILTSAIVRGLDAFPTAAEACARLVDVGGLTSEYLCDSIPATLGLGDVCGDPEIGSCGAGLICVDGLCEVDESAPCGDIPVLDFATEAVAAGEGFVVTSDIVAGFGLDSGSCGGDGAEFAIRYTAEFDQTLTVSTEGLTTIDTVLYARSGLCLDPEAELACQDDIGGGVLQSALSFDLAAGETTFILVNGYDETEAGEVGVSFTAVELGASCALAADLAAVGTGDLTTGLSVDGDSSAGISSLVGSCAGDGELEDVYTLTIPSDGRLDLEVNTTVTGFDTGLYVRLGDCVDPATEIACNDDAGGTSRSAVSIDVIAGDVLYIVVDAYSGAGAYTLSATLDTSGAQPGTCDLPVAVEDAAFFCADFDGWQCLLTAEAAAPADNFAPTCAVETGVTEWVYTYTFLGELGEDTFQVDVYPADLATAPVVTIAAVCDTDGGVCALGAPDTAGDVVATAAVAATAGATYFIIVELPNDVEPGFDLITTEFTAP